MTTTARLGRLALGVCVVATAASIPLGDVRQGGPRFALLGAALLGYAGVLFAHARSPFLTRRGVAAAVALVATVAVAVPPQGSRDVWSYVMYGRAVSRYHLSPYRTAPRDFPSDRMFHLVGRGWERTPSLYGPVFVAVAAAGTAAAGDSVLANRLFFQLLAAAALAACLWVLGRFTRGDPGALAFLGLNPLIIVSVVNGGHNDLLVGAAVLGAVALVAAGRPRWAGVALGAGVLVKVTALVPLAALVVWLWRRHGLRRAAGAALSAALTVTAGYAAAGGTVALAPVSQAAGRLSRASIWDAARHLGLHLEPTFPQVAVAVVVALVVLGWGRRDLPTAVGATALVYLLAAPWVLPGYVAWGLPVLAVVWRQRIAALGAAHAALLLLVYVDRARLDPEALHDALYALARVAAPGLEAVALVAVLAGAVMSAGRWRGRPAMG